MKLNRSNKKDKENTHRSPRSTISPKAFQTKMSCPDLWNLSNNPQTAESIFDLLFPTPNTKKLPFFLYESLTIPGLNSTSELFAKL